MGPEDRGTNGRDEQSARRSAEVRERAAKGVGVAGAGPIGQRGAALSADRQAENVAHHVTGRHSRVSAEATVHDGDGGRGGAEQGAEEQRAHQHVDQREHHEEHIQGYHRPVRLRRSGREAETAVAAIRTQKQLVLQNAELQPVHQHVHGVAPAESHQQYQGAQTQVFRTFYLNPR